MRASPQASPAAEAAIRPAERQDDDALWAMLRPVLRAGETYALDRAISRERALAYWRAPGHSVLVAGRPAQGSYYLRANQGGGGAHVANAAFVVAEAARGQGLATAMLAHAVEAARAAGFAAMQFNFVVETNPALRLWLRHGFAVVGRLPGAFRPPSGGAVDALVLHRAL